MKIIFAEPPIKKKFQSVIPQNQPYMGILYLISFLRERINDIQIYYLEGNLNVEDHINQVREIKPDLYFLSFTSFISDIAFEIIRKIKSENPLLPIICGGSHPTVNPEDVLLNGGDVCVIGEGEETIFELVEYYLNMTIRKQADILGIAYKENGNILKTKNRPLIKDLDSIPFPAWDMINITKYPRSGLSKSYPRATMIVTRGCPYNCNFCSNPVWKVNKPWLRLRSPQNIAKEVQYLYGMGVREIYLYGDEFNPVPTWSVEVCREISKLGYKDLFFQTILHANKVNNDLSKALNDINCWLVKIGIESGNQTTLDRIDKKSTLKQVEDACKSLKKYNIKIYGFFMTFHIWEEEGKLCHETPEESTNTLNYANNLLSTNLLDYISWGFTVPYPGSQVYDICLRHNIIDSKKKMTKWDKPPISYLGIDGKVLQKIKKKGMILQARYNGINGLRDCGINYIDWNHWLTKLMNILK